MMPTWSQSRRIWCPRGRSRCRVGKGAHLRAVPTVGDAAWWARFALPTLRYCEALQPRCTISPGNVRKTTEQTRRIHNFMVYINIFNLTGEFRVDNLEEKTNWVSGVAIPCFRRMNSLFPRNNFPVFSLFSGNSEGLGMG